MKLGGCMGTRHLVCVYANKRFKAAQYGQFDGYPEGTGLSVLNFVRGLTPESMKEFKKKLRNVRLHSDKEFEDKELYDKEGYKQPTAANLFEHIMTSEDQVHLINSASFAGDSLFCEWAYVLNLDTKTLDVYEGFVENEAESAEIFMKYKRPPKQKSAKNPNYTPTDYYPVKLVASYGLENLPDDEDFTERFKDDSEENE